MIVEKYIDWVNNMINKNIKKIFICLGIILAVFCFSDKVKADAGVYAQCTYTYEGYTVVVQEIKGQKINVTSNGSGSSEKKYSNDLKSSRKKFFKGSTFKCPDISVVDDGEKVNLTTDPGKKQHSTISGTYKSEYESVCSYSAGGSSVTVSPKKNGGISYKISPSSRTYWKIDHSVFYKDGSFKCIDSSELAVQTCTWEGGKDKKYWVLFSSTTDYCGDKADKKTETAKKTIVKDVTKASKWNSTDGNTNAFLKKVWGMLRVIIPALVIVLSIVDFLKIVFISDEKNYKEAYVRMLKRISVGIILFLVPALVKLILEVAGLRDIPIYEIFK